MPGYRMGEPWLIAEHPANVASDALRTVADGGWQLMVTTARGC
jgi:hypothetical protein